VIVKKIVFNKAAIITKNKVISINQLYYKAPEKFHVTQDLVGFKEQQGTFWFLHHGRFADWHNINKNDCET
jgi:hypothetical protein